MQSFSALAGKVNAESGLITGVSVLTEGEARGHDEWVDGTTLRQVKAAADAFSGGVRVKLNHYGGVESIIGSITNFRIEGKKLLGDLQLLKSHDAYSQVLEMAETMPEICGLSISFSGSPELIEKVNYARCSELYSIDLVDMPAANPDGLFAALLNLDSLNPDDMDKNSSDKTLLQSLLALVSARPTEETIPKTAYSLLETTHQTLVTKHTKAETDLSAANGKVTALEGEKTTLNTKVTELTTKVTELETKLADQKKNFEATVKEHAGKEAATILAKLGIAPVPTAGATPPGTPPATEKTLLQEYNEADTKGKARIYAEYGHHNIMMNIRKPRA